MPRTLPRLYLACQGVMNTIEKAVYALKKEDEVEDELVNELRPWETHADK